jgi:hypothetical protein
MTISGSMRADLDKRLMELEAKYDSCGSINEKNKLLKDIQNLRIMMKGL